MFSWIPRSNSDKLLRRLQDLFSRGLRDEHKGYLARLISLASRCQRPECICYTSVCFCVLCLVRPGRGKPVQYLRTLPSAKNGFDSCDKQFLSDCLCPSIQMSRSEDWRTSWTISPKVRGSLLLLHASKWCIYCEWRPLCSMYSPIPWWLDVPHDRFGHQQHSPNTPV